MCIDSKRQVLNLHTPFRQGRLIPFQSDRIAALFAKGGLPIEATPCSCCCHQSLGRVRLMRRFNHLKGLCRDFGVVGLACSGLSSVVAEFASLEEDLSDEVSDRDDLESTCRALSGVAMGFSG
jgi:hypothetical protein